MRVFIGSSKESLSWAEKVALAIETAGHCPLLWNNVGLFTPGRYTLESLEKICENVDAAIFVFNEDDKIWYRDELTHSVRDNVLFEYGLFCGYLSRDNVCFCLVGSARIASDLSGLSYVNLNQNQSQRAQLEIKTWLSKISDHKVQKESIFKVMNFLDAFYYAIGSATYLENIKIFSLSTFRVAPIFLAKYDLKISEATIMLKNYVVNGSFYDESLSRRTDTAIEMWNSMRNKGNIKNLNIYKYDYQPSDGYYIINDSILIYANLFVDTVKDKIYFDDYVFLVENKTEDGSKLINMFIDKFDKFKKNLTETPSDR